MLEQNLIPTQTSGKKMLFYQMKGRVNAQICSYLKFYKNSTKRLQIAQIYSNRMWTASTYNTMFECSIKDKPIRLLTNSGDALKKCNASTSYNFGRVSDLQVVISDKWIAGWMQEGCPKASLTLTAMVQKSGLDGDFRMRLLKLMRLHLHC